jgi:glycerol-3-phosphate dehydrogenase
MRRQREAQLDRLDNATVDLLVVGGGIVGSRIAYNAARSGLRTALVDRGDFGGATSSSSSKLVHGGLRYLSTGDVRLVRRLQAEKNTLMAAVAPHLVKALKMLVVVDAEHRGRAAKLAAGLGIYTAVAGSQRPRPCLVRRAHAETLIPDLDVSRIAAAGVVTEGQTHDARLVLATVRAASEAGALELNYVEVCAIESVRDACTGAVLRDLVGGRELVVRARAIVNATGPWVDGLRALEDPRSRLLARLSKGVHAVLPLEQPWGGGLALFDESQSAFAVPWQGMLLVGTTDTDHEGSVEELGIESDDIASVLEPLAGLLPSRTLDPERVVHSFAGIRVLPRGDGASARASRDHVLDVGSKGMISVAGGKLTTHRTIAHDVLARLPHELRPRRIGAGNEPLPGASLNGAVAKLREHLDFEVVSHLLGLYGADALDLLPYRAAHPNALERIDTRGPDIWAQVYRARDEEWVVTADDVVARRTTLAVRGLGTDDVRCRIATVLGDGAQGARSSEPSIRRSSS